MRSLFIIFQYLAPQHLLSRLAGVFANSTTPWIRKRFIHWFIHRYQVDMRDAAEENPDKYENFNAFFTRKLKPGVRPVVAGEELLACPADGVISELGEIRDDQLLQAKGRWFSLIELLACTADEADAFRNGSFVTIYLSPRDYHRVHMPLSGQLVATRYIPGKLFSVNQATADAVPNLFARNERLVCRFATEIGPVIQVMVGAMIVAGIETVWSGQICPGASGDHCTDYRNRVSPVYLRKGEEMACFNLGSTVITLFPAGAVTLQDSLRAGSPVRMGEILARVNRHD